MERSKPKRSFDPKAKNSTNASSFAKAQESPIPSAEYGVTEIGSSPKNVPNRAEKIGSSQIQPKKHPGLKRGDVLQNKNDFYQIDTRIATGGMAIIWKAHNIKNKQIIVVKQFMTSKYYDPTTNKNNCEEYWQRERDIIQKQSLSPSTTMKCLDAIKSTDLGEPEYYLLLEYIEGLSLEEWIYRQPYLPSTNEELIFILEQIILPLCNHLNYIHEHGIIHRDITPKNIVLTTRNEQTIPILIDWGVAKEKAVDEMFSPQKPYFENNFEETIGIHSVGNPPEELGGFEPVAATDIYMLGNILFALLTKGMKFSKPIITQDYILHPNEFNPNIPTKLNGLVEAMTQYEPADRIPNCQSIIEQITPILQTLPNLGPLTPDLESDTYIKSEPPLRVRSTYVVPPQPSQPSQISQTEKISTSAKLHKKIHDLQHTWQQSAPDREKRRKALKATIKREIIKTAIGIKFGIHSMGYHIRHFFNISNDSEQLFVGMGCYFTIVGLGILSIWLSAGFAVFITGTFLWAIGGIVYHYHHR